MVVLENVMERLGMFGMTTEQINRGTLQYELDKIYDYTVNFCNLSSKDELPMILDRRIIDRVCAEYLYLQKNSGNLADFDYNSYIAKSIKEGDTQIQFLSGGEAETPESRFDTYVENLKSDYDKWICKWRRLRW